MFFNWIPSMAMLIKPLANAGMAKITNMAKMVTSVMANGNFSMAIRVGGGLFRTFSGAGGFRCLLP